MDKEKVYIASACYIQLAKINGIIFNQFSPDDLKIDAETYYKIIEQLNDIEKILADSYNPLVKKS